MANMRDPNKRMLGGPVSRELWYRVKQYLDGLPEKEQMSVSEFRNRLMEKEMDRLGIVLSDESRRKIKDEVRKVKNSRRH